MTDESTRLFVRGRRAPGHVSLVVPRTPPGRGIYRALGSFGSLGPRAVRVIALVDRLHARGGWRRRIGQAIAMVVLELAVVRLKRRDRRAS